MTTSTTAHAAQTRTTAPRAQEWGITALRLVVGLTFLVHGVDKLFLTGIDGVSGFFGQLGVPLPGAAAWSIALLELVGGAALVVGLFTRVLAVLLAAELLVAIFLVHLANGFFVADGGYEHALLLMVASVTLALTGAGALAVDRALRPRGGSRRQGRVGTA